MVDYYQLGVKIATSLSKDCWWKKMYHLKRNDQNISKHYTPPPVFAKKQQNQKNRHLAPPLLGVLLAWYTSEAASNTISVLNIRSLVSSEMRFRPTVWRQPQTSKASWKPIQFSSAKQWIFQLLKCEAEGWLCGYWLGTVKQMVAWAKSPNSGEGNGWKFVSDFCRVGCSFLHLSSGQRWRPLKHPKTPRSLPWDISATQHCAFAPAEKRAPSPSLSWFCFTFYLSMAK